MKTQPVPISARVVRTRIPVAPTPIRADRTWTPVVRIAVPRPSQPAVEAAPEGRDRGTDPAVVETGVVDRVEVALVEETVRAEEAAPRGRDPGAADRAVTSHKSS